jgi:hypothetical protein
MLSNVRWRCMAECKYGSMFFNLNILDGSKWQVSYCFTTQKTAWCTQPQITHWIQSWVGPRAKVDIGEEKCFYTCHQSNPGYPIAHSLLWLSYLSSLRQQSTADYFHHYCVFTWQISVKLGMNIILLEAPQPLSNFNYLLSIITSCQKFKLTM